MNWLPPPERTVKFVAALAGVLALYAVLRPAGLHDYARSEMEGLHVLILLVGGIYSVLLAFAIFVIWTQFTQVEESITRECGDLADLLRFSACASPEAATAIRRAAAAYIHQVFKYEWRALGEGRRDRQAGELFSDVTGAVLELKPREEADRLLHAQLLDIVREAGRHREERVAKSLTRMPATLSGLVNTIALVLLLLVFVYPFHSVPAGMIAVALVAIVLFLANFCMMDTDNPFAGVWNVSNRPFHDLSVGG
jgi:Protein of unknown function (DUF4239)